MKGPGVINIAVTGNRPFLEYKFNTSQLVRDALPDGVKSGQGKEVQILKYHRDTFDTYEDVRQVTKDIWSGRRSYFSNAPPCAADVHEEEPLRIDAILHLGMIALGWDPDQFRFETLARRDGYKLPGDDGRHVDSAELKGLGLPASLATSFDVETACSKVRQDHPGVPIRVSDDAGLYFCEFRLYSSLAEPCLTEELSAKHGRVLFQHLPQRHDQQSITLARDVTLSYVSAVADDVILSQ